MKKSWIIGIAATALISTSSIAADMPVKAPQATPPAEIVDWSGVYLGGQLGGAWGTGSFTHLADAPPLGPFQPIGQGGSISGSGFFGGGQVGAQRQFGNIVAGIEGSLVYTNLDKTAHNPFFPGVDINDRFSIKSVASFVGRLGYASQKWLAYVKGGYASGNTNYTGYCGPTAGCAPVNFAISVDSRHSGYTLGGGIEYMLWRNITVGVDYSYVKLSDKTDTAPYNAPGFVGTYNTNANVHFVALRANYLFKPF